MRLYNRLDFAFHVNWHSAGQWLLYPEGWQTGTPTADDPIYFALSGNLDNPAIEDFHPGLSSDVLYVTNGETTDFAHAQRGTLAWTPELSEGLRGLRVRVPGRRGPRPGRVRAEPSVRARRRQVGEGPGRPGLAPRDRHEAVLLEERRHVQDRGPRRELHVRGLLRRSAGGPRPRQEGAPERRSQVPDQRRQGAERQRQQVQGRRPLRRDRGLLPGHAAAGSGEPSPATR